ncbi:MAG: DUF2840 domain-containing protein [Variovorax sp.]
MNKPSSERAQLSLFRALLAGDMAPRDAQGMTSGRSAGLCRGAAPASSRHADVRALLGSAEHRVKVGRHLEMPVRETTPRRRRRMAMFAPVAVCCRVMWKGSDDGTNLLTLMALRAPRAIGSASGSARVADVVPGARMLLRVNGESQVKAVLDVFDAIVTAGIDLRAVAAALWHIIGNRPAARSPFSECTAGRHPAHPARAALQ